MIVNHVNSSVPEVEVTAAFFVEHFGLRRVAEREGMLVVLCDEASTVLTLSNFYKDVEVAQARGFHLGLLSRAGSRGMPSTTGCMRPDSPTRHPARCTEPGASISMRRAVFRWKFRFLNPPRGEAGVPGEKGGYAGNAPPM